MSTRDRGTHRRDTEGVSMRRAQERSKRHRGTGKGVDIREAHRDTETRAHRDTETRDRAVDERHRGLST